jgi:energy-coupling factor transporter ATP-binding protein EcfA2
MIIKALSVEAVGRFANPAHIEGFGPGINVLAAGNEVGKSTLFRAIRTCLFSRHDSKNQDIKDLGSDDSQLPATVQLSFERNSRSYVIRKAFLRSPSATLTEDGHEIARGKQADEAIWDLLGISPGSGRTIDEGAFGVLWVGQGASFAPPTPAAGASSMLNAAIEAEVGTLVGGERARLVLEQASGELKRHITDTERPRSDGPLHSALRDVEKWRTAEADARSKLVALEQQFAELLQRHRRHAEVTDPVVVAQMTQDLIEARQGLEEGRSSIQEIRRLEAQEDSARRAVEVVAQRLKQFRQLVCRIDSNRKIEIALAIELPEQQAREQEIRAALTRTAEQIATTDRQLHVLTGREQQLEKLAGAMLRAQCKDDLERQLAAVERAATELRETATKRKQLPSSKEMDEEKLALRQERSKLDARRANRETTREQQRKALENGVEARSGTQSKVEMIQTTIAEDIALCPDDERATRDSSLVGELAAAEKAHEIAATILSVRRAAAPDSIEIERREARCQRLEQAIENQNNELMDLQRDIGRLSGQIQAAGGDGVGEALAAAQEQRAMAERDLRRVQGRVAMLQLLCDVVSSCMTEGRNRYYVPVRRRLRPFLNDLFPGAELELGDGFAITGITRQRTEAFDRLSDGTREQIAVLVRLAMGALLTERGEAAPIILDDALVYCDDDRIERMFDALSRAGKNQQIIVLTCRLRSFGPLGGHTLRVNTAGASLTRPQC